MKIEKFVCDNCKEELNRDIWLYSVTGDIVNISADSDKGCLMLKSGHYCAKCFKEKIKSLI